MKDQSTILLIGAGNTLRGDDGLGPLVVQKLDAMQIPNLHTKMVQQLTSELVFEMLDYPVIIITDASVSGDPVTFYKAEADSGYSNASSHASTAAQLMQLAEKMYQQSLNLYICGIRGYDFSLTEGISEQALAHADKAIDLLANWIREQKY